METSAVLPTSQPTLPADSSLEPAKTQQRPPKLREGTLAQRLCKVLPEYGLWAIFIAVVFAVVLGMALLTFYLAPLPGTLLPVTVTIKKAILEPVGIDGVRMDVDFTLVDNGKTYTRNSFRFFGTRKEVPTDLLAHYESGATTTAYMWPGRPDTATLFPRYAGEKEWRSVASLVVGTLPVCGITLLCAWLIGIAVLRPAAAALPYSVEPGRRVWVRLRWSQVPADIFFCHVRFLDFYRF